MTLRTVAFMTAGAHDWPVPAGIDRASVLLMGAGRQGMAVIQSVGLHLGAGEVLHFHVGGLPYQPNILANGLRIVAARGRPAGQPDLGPTEYGRLQGSIPPGHYPDLFYEAFRFPSPGGFNGGGQGWVSGAWRKNDNGFTARHLPPCVYEFTATVHAVGPEPANWPQGLQITSLTRNGAAVPFTPGVPDPAFIAAFGGATDPDTGMPYPVPNTPDTFTVTGGTEDDDCGPLDNLWAVEATAAGLDLSRMTIFNASNTYLVNWVGNTLTTTATIADGADAMIGWVVQNFEPPDTDVVVTGTLTYIGNTEETEQASFPPGPFVYSDPTNFMTSAGSGGTDLRRAGTGVSNRVLVSGGQGGGALGLQTVGFADVPAAGGHGAPVTGGDVVAVPLLVDPAVFVGGGFAGDPGPFSLFFRGLAGSKGAGAPAIDYKQLTRGDPNYPCQGDAAYFWHGGAGGGGYWGGAAGSVYGTTVPQWTGPGIGLNPLVFPSLLGNYGSNHATDPEALVVGYWGDTLPLGPVYVDDVVIADWSAAGLPEFDPAGRDGFAIVQYDDDAGQGWQLGSLGFRLPA